MKLIFKGLCVFIIWVLFVSGLLLTGCGSGSPNFSILPDSDTFYQSTSFNNKIDIIWMVDDSGTMANHQSNLATNFNQFINGFVNKGFDYHMVVASTDSWVREYNYNAGTCYSNPNPTQNPNTMYRSSADCQNTLASFGMLTWFRDGDIYGEIGGAPGPRSGVYLLTSIMNPTTVMNTFATNVRTGTRGDGVAEAGFQSLRSVLRRNADGSIGYGGESHTVLNSFRRNDAFLAVIIISDEEDQSRKQDGTTYSNTQQYVDGFTTFMDGYTGSVPGNRIYNISSIVLEDINNCPYGLNPQASQGDRYVAISNASNGVVGNICSTDFSQQLSAISDRIITLSTRFQFSREPVPSSIVVFVNGILVPQNPVNGWAYIVDNGFYYVEFHGTAVPPQGAAIVVNFDPARPL